MPLPKFPVTGNLHDVLATLTGGEITTPSWSNAYVILASNIKDGILVWNGEIYNRPSAVKATVDAITGNIEIADGPVKLVDNDPGLNVTGIQYRCDIKTSSSNVIASFWFDAPGDGSTVNLASVAHVPTTSVQQVPELPAQSGNGGKFLTTDGSSPSWGTPAGGGGSGTPADGTITFSMFAPAAVVTAGETIAANNNDTTVPTSAAVLAALNARAMALTATAVKTSAYTAAAGDLVPVDATAGTVPIGLPTAPADKTRIAIKKVDASTNTVTIPAGGSDVFNKSGGSTSLTLSLPNQGVQLQYKASGAIWYVVSTDVPLSGLDARFVATAGSTAFGRSLLTQLDAPAVRSAIQAGNAPAVSITQEGVGTPTPTTVSTPGTSEVVFNVCSTATGIAVVYAHSNYDESDPAGAITFNASIKVAGVVYRLTFNGRTTAVLDPGGQVTSDRLGLMVSAGDAVTIRTYLASGTACAPRSIIDVANRGGFIAGGDLTMSGTAISPVTGYSYGPSMLVGQADPASKSVLLVGDSILRGVGDGQSYVSTQVVNAPQWCMGGFAVRALAGHTGIVTIAKVSEKANLIVSAAAYRRLAYANRCTSAIVELGINDFHINQTAAQLEADLMTICKSLRRDGIRKIFLTTITPETTSTDGWATVTNQTVVAGALPASRVLHNNWVRAGCPLNPTTLAPVTVGTGGALLAGTYGHPITGYFEVADTVESARDSGKWKAARRVVSTAVTTVNGSVINATGAAFTSGLITAGGDVGTTINIVGAATGPALFTTLVDTVNSATQISTLGTTDLAVSAATMAIGATTFDGLHPASDGHLLMSAAIDWTLL